MNDRRNVTYPILTKTVQYHWAIYGKSGASCNELAEQVDKFFLDDYSIYPQYQWELCGLYPPDCDNIYGAWRHINSYLFAFLVNHPFLNNDKQTICMLQVVGFENEVNKIKEKVLSLKKNDYAVLSTTEEKNHNFLNESNKKSNDTTNIIVAAIAAISNIIASIGAALIKLIK